MVLPFKGILYETTTLANGQAPAGVGRRLPCADFELNFAECLEAHGAIKGGSLCKQYHEDLQECRHGFLSIVRAQVLTTERNKQLVTRQRPWSERWGKMYHGDSYINACFYP